MPDRFYRLEMAENHGSGSIARGSLFIVSGPSGSGKTSLCQLALGDLSGIRFSVSYTTRLPRPNEIDGQDYFFIPEAEFHHKVSCGDFLEWARVYGNFYGTGRSFVEQVLQSGADVLLDIDVQGALQVKERMPEAIATLVFPPDYATLRRRLKSRALDRREVIHGRLEIAKSELLRYRQYDYLITNDDLAVAGDELKAIITASRLEVRRRSGAAEKILTSFEAPADDQEAAANESCDGS